MKLTKFKKPLIIILVVLVLLGGLAYGIFHFYYTRLNVVDAENIDLNYIDDEEYLKQEQDDTLENSSKEEVDAANAALNNNNFDKITDSDVTNILLIGSDTREKGGTARSDSMIIVSINNKTKEITTTSLLRDIYVKIPGHGNNKLNAAFAFGGVKLLEETIEENFKINIDRYVIVDFFSFVDIVDILGGVEIDVTDDEVEYINAYLDEINKLKGYKSSDDELTKSGFVKLDGRQALSYARIRYIGTDFGRTERQRKILAQIFESTKESSFATLNKLYLSISPLITTDLTEGEIMGLLFDMPNYKSYAINSNHIPYDNTYKTCTINRMSVISIDFEQNITMFNKNIYKVTTENAVAKKPLKNITSSYKKTNRFNHNEPLQVVLLKHPYSYEVAVFFI